MTITMFITLCERVFGNPFMHGAYIRYVFKTTSSKLKRWHSLTLYIRLSHGLIALYSMNYLFCNSMCKRALKFAVSSIVGKMCMTI